jgi:TonB-linked SusC/RagA family outer membrane protein
MVAGPIFSEAKVLPRYVQSVADTKVTGKVTDAKGEPIPGVAVRVKGTNKGANTDVNGNFSLYADNAVLVISSVGYETQEVPVNGRSSINITLQNSSKELAEVVFVGYGTQRKMDVTGAVVSVKGEEISKQASVNAVSSLQGKVAGVQINNSGAPGASPQIRIRGLGTVYGNPNPLYVVDGVWFDDISFLNPADIESMNVLKDASAQSIYGIRAANGVILITTKKGKAEQTTITYNASYGVQRVSNQLEMANANEFATMVNELSIINGGSQVLDPSKFSKGTDWYRVGLRSAPVTNHQISLAGGSEKSTYNFSLGYLNQAGLVEGNNFDRYTARLQNDYQLFKNLKVGYSVTGAASTSKDAPPAIFRQLYSAAPVVPVYYADGTYGDPSDYNLGDGANYNPQATLDFYNQKTTNYRLTGNVFADLNFAKHFTFHTSIGGEFRQTEVRNYTPVFAATLRQRTTVSTLNVSRAENRNWILENTLSYDNTFNKDHNVRILVGQSAQSYRAYGINASAQNVPNKSEGICI